jgi:hypothetical protein
VSRVWFWLGVFFCAFLATSASGYSQYYIVLMPFWALLSAVGIHTLSSRINASSVRTSRWLGRLLMALVVLLVMCPDVPWLICSRERFVEVKMDGFPFIGSQTVARRVAELSSPGQFVFIAGSEPQILFYAQRFSPTRFITAYALMIPTAVAKKYQRETIEDLQEHPPKLIVFTLTKNSWLRQAATPTDFPDFLEQFLRQNYVLIGGYLPHKQKGVWSEPLAANEVADADLLLFMRKPLQ